MINLNDYFNHVNIEKPGFNYLDEFSSFAENIRINTEDSEITDIHKFKIALVGVPEGRNAPSTGSSTSPDKVREHLYRLCKIPGKMKIVDLGNIKTESSFSDTITKLAEIIIYLTRNNVFPLIIGGNSSLTIGIDRAMSEMKIKYTLATVDSRIDYNSNRQNLNPFNFLNAIIHNPISTLNHLINIGYQTYLNDPRILTLFMKKESELIRIGDARQHIQLMEPLLRDSDVAIFDMSSVRQADAPGTFNPSPNGLYGEEICLLARYAGISNHLKIFSLFDIDTDLDVRDQTSRLAAQIIWFFLEGYAQKIFEFPTIEKTDDNRFIKYHVSIPDADHDLIFIKSICTDRWWVKLSADNDNDDFMACSHEDYIKANKNEISERLLMGIRRLNNG